MALDLWRGPALADLAFESFAEHEASRLEEIRLAALEDRIDADLECERYAELVARWNRSSGTTRFASASAAS